MNIGIVKAYMLKEFKELFRTRLIVVVYLMPIMVLTLFGYGIKMDVSHARLIILDNDQSKLSLMLCSKFEHTKFFNTKILHISEKEALRKIKQNRADVILIIPGSFEKTIFKGQKSELGIFTDASFPTRGRTIESYV